MTERTAMQTTIPRRVPGIDLRRGRRLAMLNPGDVIVGSRGLPITYLLALRGGVACDVRDGTVSIEVAGVAGTDRVLVAADDVLRIADWLRVRGHGQSGKR